MLASGTDIAIVSKVLGHSTISLTSDTYAHLLEDASALVPRAGKDASDTACNQSATNMASDSSEGPRRDDEGPGIANTDVRRQGLEPRTR
jgi:hypothetical protein